MDAWREGERERYTTQWVSADGCAASSRGYKFENDGFELKRDWRMG